MKKYLLDARAMNHPEPLERAISILRNLDKRGYLYMIHRMQPIPLLALANDYNLNAISFENEGVWHILITPNREVDLKELLELDIEKEALDVSK